MYKPLFLVFCFLLFLSLTFGQRNKKYELGLVTGYSDIGFKDELISPQIYSGANMLWNLHYSEENKVKKELLELEVNYANLTSSPGTKKNMKYSNSCLSYSYYIKSLSIEKGKIKILPGAGFLTDHYYKQLSVPVRAFNSSLNTSFNELVASVNITAMVAYNIGEKSSLLFLVKLPVFAYINRPGYSLMNEWSMKFSKVKTLNSYFYAKTSINYHYLFCKQWKFSAGFELAYYSVSFPFPYKYLSRNFKTGIYYAF